eukprot:scaffold7.g3613.t1
MAELCDPTVPVVQNLLLLDSEGKRIAVKYYSKQWATVPQQAEFEKSVFAKTARTNARGEPEIIMFDDVVVVFKFIGDLQFYVTGAADENEVILAAVLQARGRRGRARGRGGALCGAGAKGVLRGGAGTRGGFYDSITLLLRNAVEKKTVLENLDLVLLAIDEICEGGVILETDASVVASRVTMRTADDGTPVALEAHNPGLHTLSQAFGNVKEQLTRSLLK